MPSQELLDYIQEELNAGTTTEELKKALAGVGWSENQIMEGLKMFSQNPPAEAAPQANYSQLPGRHPQPLYHREDAEGEGRGTQRPHKMNMNSVLIGLIPALLVLGSLILILFPGVLGDTEKDKEVRSQLSSIQLTLEIYHDTYNSYPKTLEQLLRGNEDILSSDLLTNDAYSYNAVDGGEDYMVCALLSRGREICLSASDL